MATAVTQIAEKKVCTGQRAGASFSAAGRDKPMGGYGRMLNATSLDDPGQFNPQVVTYTIRGHAWDTIGSSLQKFERMALG